MQNTDNDSNKRDRCSRSHALTGSFRSLLAKELRAERHRYKKLDYEAKTPYSYGLWRGRMGLLKELSKSKLAEKNSPVLTRSEAES